MNEDPIDVGEQGYQFVQMLDQEFTRAGNEEMLVYWTDGVWEEIYPYIEENYPDAPVEVVEWVREFVEEP